MNTISLMFKYLTAVFPKVNSQLNIWKHKCSAIDDKVLRELALASIARKKFHCQGGSIYSIYPQTDTTAAIKFIVAFQTISDYLDNLCDMAGIADEAAFRQLHLALSDAVDLATIHDYYQFYPYQKDNGYLLSLVRTCQQQLKELKSYHLVAESFKKYVRFYTALQSLKHLSINLREDKLQKWTQSEGDSYNNIYWWEFAAASGSTLLVFCLFAAAFNSDLTVKEVEAFNTAYFPWICGLHILLDYYIDFEEDRQANELNFCSYYLDLTNCQQRIAFFVERSLQGCQMLHYPQFHKTVINGLLAMYLSDPKAYNGQNNSTTASLLKSGDFNAEIYHYICKALRKFKKL